MANEEHVRRLLRGVTEWNEWRRKSSDAIRPYLSSIQRGCLLKSPGQAELGQIDLSGADLNHADLREANLSAVNLRAANLNAANLVLADLAWADLTEANLRSAVLRKAELSQAVLYRADLSGADLEAADFSGAHLREATLKGARLREVVFGDTDLSQARGLSLCIHLGPSTIDHRTILRSDQVPNHFLRGCGVPEQLITYMPSILNEAIHLHSCFISYSTADREFAERLHEDLQNNGVRCWFAPHAVQGGQKLHEQIDQAIQMHDRLLLLLSEASMNSEWVKTEIAKARKRELREKRRMIFPVRLVEFEALRDWECFDADTGKDSAREIREYYVPDFSDWKTPESYRKELDRLISSLKPETGEERTRTPLPNVLS